MQQSHDGIWEEETKENMAHNMSKGLLKYMIFWDKKRYDYFELKLVVKEISSRLEI